MPSSMIVVLVLIAAAANALRRGRRYELITARPYNNRHSDATGARDEHALALEWSQMLGGRARGR
ncbi:MAG TPA: hypothetical protein VFV03_02040 [Solirubrobacteraceae bacterium]|nr:hypothetical protein [Solirubrobacteraceae bacterium]